MYSLEEFHFCRLCLCGGENLMDIFEDNPKFDFVVDETIQDLLQLKVVKVVGCPWLICSTCLYKLTDFRLFKRRCVECKIAYENRFNPYNTFLDTSNEAAVKVYENGILNSLVESDPVSIPNGNIICGDNLRDDLNNGIGCPEILPNWDAKGSKVDNILQGAADLIFGANITGDDVNNIVSAQESIEKAVADSFTACDGITPNISLRTKVDIFAAELWKEENSGMVIPEMDSGIVSAYTEPEIPPSARIVGVVEGSAVMTGEPNLPVQDFDEEVRNMAAAELQTMTDQVVCIAENMTEKKFVCVFCGKSFEWENHLYEHIREHSDFGPFQCRTCGKNYKCATTLRNHVRRNHSEKKYKCDECDRCFSVEYYLKKHKGTHASDKATFACDICPKKFCRVGTLNEHRRSHSNERNYMCAVCEKGYTRKDYLASHMTKHTGQMRYICRLCPRGYRIYSSYKYHMKSHHAIE